MLRERLPSFCHASGDDVDDDDDDDDIELPMLGAQKFLRICCTLSVG